MWNSRDSGKLRSEKEGAGHPPRPAAPCAKHLPLGVAPRACLSLPPQLQVARPDMAPGIWRLEKWGQGLWPRARWGRREGHLVPGGQAQGSGGWGVGGLTKTGPPGTPLSPGARASSL